MAGPNWLKTATAHTQRFNVTKFTIMKNLKITFIILLGGLTVAHGQQNQHKINSVDVATASRSEALKGNDLNLTDSNLDKYAGTWVWKSGNKTLTLKLKKETIHYGRNNHVLDLEVISGNYEYLANGKTISNFSDNEVKGSSGGKKDTINVFVDVKTRKTMAALLLTYLNSNTVKLELDKNKFEFKNDKNFELPNSIVLIKQN